MSTENNKWKIVGHSHQIADTGDYDGCYELTNGKISLFTKDEDWMDDIEGEHPLVTTLNNMNIKWEIDDSSEFMYQAEKEWTNRLSKEVEDWKDIASNFYRALKRREYNTDEEVECLDIYDNYIKKNQNENT